MRSKISNYFSENNLKQPDFCWQGSFSMGTTIKDPDANYDLDDGIYLNHLSDNKEDWPSAEDMHDLIVDSVKNHTSKNIQNKRKCVRVQYADNHHIDLAIYGKNDDKYYLAVKGDLQWEENSAKSFIDFFLPRAVLYFKQAVGRLIRHEDDYGLWVVLDNRILNKNYGKYFLDVIQNVEVIEDIEKALYFIKEEKHG